MGVTPKLKYWKFIFSCKMNEEKIVKCKGVNIFLGWAKGGPAYGLRKNFKYTDKVNKIIDGCFVVFYGD